MIFPQLVIDATTTASPFLVVPRGDFEDDLTAVRTGLQSVFPHAINELGRSQPNTPLSNAAKTRQGVGKLGVCLEHSSRPSEKSN